MIPCYRALFSFLPFALSIVSLSASFAPSISNNNRAAVANCFLTSVFDTMEWTPLRPKRLAVDPSVLVHTGTVVEPQLAKNVEYARAIQEAWRREAATKRLASESTALSYKDNEDTVLYGHAFRRQGTPTTALVPGILFFHTAAGPHDVCLHWKADSLVTNDAIFPDGCVVLIADILSDDIGWGWSSDRTRYNEARKSLLTPTEEGVCTRLQSRLQAALDKLLAIPSVDSTRLAAMGWCLGGLSILELARMKVPGMRAVVTFHGVFDGKPPSAADGCADNDPSMDFQALICNGDSDPFVSLEMLDAAIATFEQHSCQVRLMSLKGARHGFTNPAQDFNPTPSFGYNHDAAVTSWNAACSLLQSKLMHSTAAKGGADR